MPPQIGNERHQKNALVQELLVGDLQYRLPHEAPDLANEAIRVLVALDDLLEQRLAHVRHEPLLRTLHDGVEDLERGLERLPPFGRQLQAERLRYRTRMHHKNRWNETVTMDDFCSTRIT